MDPCPLPGEHPRGALLWSGGFTTKRLLNVLSMMAVPTATGIALILMFDSARRVKLAVILAGVVVGLLLLWASHRAT